MQELVLRQQSSQSCSRCRRVPRHVVSLERDNGNSSDSFERTSPRCSAATAAAEAGCGTGRRKIRAECPRQGMH
jgi:hypothetical protein